MKVNVGDELYAPAVWYKDNTIPERYTEGTLLWAMKTLTNIYKINLLQKFLVRWWDRKRLQVAVFIEELLEDIS